MFVSHLEHYGPLFGVVGYTSFSPDIYLQRLSNGIRCSSRSKGLIEDVKSGGLDSETAAVRKPRFGNHCSETAIRKLRFGNRGSETAVLERFKYEFVCFVLSLVIVIVFNSYHVLY